MSERCAHLCFDSKHFTTAFLTNYIWYTQIELKVIFYSSNDYVIVSKQNNKYDILICSEMILQLILPLSWNFKRCVPVRSIRSSWLLRSVRVFDVDVLGLPISPIFKGQTCPSKIGPIVIRYENRLTLRNNPEDRRLHFNHGGSLKSRYPCLFPWFISSISFLLF